MIEKRRQSGRFRHGTDRQKRSSVHASSPGLGDRQQGRDLPTKGRLCREKQTARARESAPKQFRERSTPDGRNRINGFGSREPGLRGTAQKCLMKICGKLFHPLYLVRGPTCAQSRISRAACLHPYRTQHEQTRRIPFHRPSVVDRSPV